jgi:hypothetical protein
MALYEAHYFTAPKKLTTSRLPVPNTEMSEQRLSSQGRLIHALLDLEEISPEETADVRRQLAVEVADPEAEPATASHEEDPPPAGYV